MQKQHFTNIIKAEALRLGFSACGISKAEYLKSEAEYLKYWLNNGYQAEMKYLEKNIEKRLDPTKLVENTQSIISVIHSYNPAIKSTNSPQIAYYAYGEDYHLVIKEKLNALLLFMNKEIGLVTGRAFVDSAPVLERKWAQLSGLGWIGKNTNLINKKFGSFIFIGELLVDLELIYDNPINDACGNCNRCIKACPTGAILESKKIDSRKCLSYQLIENKGNLPYEIESKIDEYIFGCDICQQVCPWNKKAKVCTELRYLPKPELLKMTEYDWLNLDQNTYNKLFKNTAIERIGFDGLKRNIALF